MKNINKNRSFPKSVVGNLPLPESFVKEELSSYFIKQVEDPRQKPSGITTIFNNNAKAFTLIELLVVVLIIGILAAVAVPQYQKAVDKTRFVQLQTTMNSIQTSNEEYFLANGSYANNFDTFELPATGCTLTTANFLTCSWGTCYVYNNGYNYGCRLPLPNGDEAILEHFPGSGVKQCVALGDNVSSSSRVYQLCNSLPHSTHYAAADCSKPTCFRFTLK